MLFIEGMCSRDSRFLFIFVTRGSLKLQIQVGQANPIARQLLERAHNF